MGNCVKKADEKNKCKGCILVNPQCEKEERPEGVIELNGGWCLNHYYGGEGFLGWLALSPIKHKEELKDLDQAEACALGGNIRRVEEALKKYWSNKPEFRDDSFWKIYVIYFSESKDYHLHFHLIPRTKKFSGSFSSCKPAWETPKMTICWDDFPKEYRIRSREQAIEGKSEPDEKGMLKVKDLMVFLKENLEGAKWLVKPK